MDMIVLIEEIADYIIPEDNEIRKGLGEIMGGKILKLRSEELLEQGEARGRLTGLREGRLTGLHEAKIDAIQNMIDLGLTREQILRKYSPEEYEEALRSMPEKYSQIHSWHIPKTSCVMQIWAEPGKSGSAHS